MPSWSSAEVITTSRMKPYTIFVRMVESAFFSVTSMPVFSCRVSTLVALSRGLSRSLTMLATKIPTARMMPAATSLGRNSRKLFARLVMGVETLCIPSLSSTPGRNRRNVIKYAIFFISNSVF